MSFTSFCVILISVEVVLDEKANMDCAEVSRIEAGKRLKPNVLYLKGITEALDLSMVNLMKLAG